MPNRTVVRGVESGVWVAYVLRNTRVGEGSRGKLGEDGIFQGLEKGSTVRNRDEIENANLGESRQVISHLIYACVESDQSVGVNWFDSWLKSDGKRRNQVVGSPLQSVDVFRMDEIKASSKQLPIRRRIEVYLIYIKPKDVVQLSCGPSRALVRSGK